MENIDLIYRKKETFAGNERGNDLLEPKLRKKIRISVLSVHFGFLLVLVLWYLIANFLLSKKPTIIQVTLVTPDSAPVISPTPPTPALTPAKPTPPVVKPKKRKPKPTPKKPKPRPKPKKAWKPLSADDIKISKKEIKNSDPTPTHRPLLAKDIEQNLKNTLLKNKVTTTTKRGTQGAKISQNYFEKISALMYQQWQQPGQSELRGKYPVVDVEITVDGTGRIVKSRIVRKSGISVMDQSASKLLRELRRLPRPPSGKTTFTVSLEIVRD